MDLVPRQTFEQAAKLKAPSLKNVPRTATEAFNSYHYSQYAPILREDETQNMLAEVERMNNRVRVAQMINQAAGLGGAVPHAVPIPPAGLQGVIDGAQGHAAAAANVGHQAVVQAQVGQAAAQQAQGAMGQAAGPADIGQGDPDRWAWLRRRIRPGMRAGAQFALGAAGWGQRMRTRANEFAMLPVGRDWNLGAINAMALRHAQQIGNRFGRRARRAAIGAGQQALGMAANAAQAIAPPDDDDFQMPDYPVWIQDYAGAGGGPAQAELNRIANDRPALQAAALQIANFLEQLGDADAAGLAGGDDRRVAMNNMRAWDQSIRRLIGAAT